MYRDYWPPLYAYVRRRGYEPAAAEDIAQDFFVTLLEKQRLNGLTREGGKFRSFLLTALKNHLANEWARSRAAPGRSRLGGDALPGKRPPRPLPPPPHLVIPKPYRKTLALLFLRAARTTIPALWHGCRLLLQPRRLHELRRQQLEVRHQLRLLANEYAKLHAREEIFGRG